MVSKKILGVAIAAAFSSQAFAALDLTAPNGGSGAITIAKESVLTTQVDSNNGLIQSTHATNYDSTFALGFGVSAGSHAFIRVDLTGGAKFKTGLSAASLTLTGKTLQSGATLNDYNVQLAQGGAAGDSYVIFDVTANTVQAQNQALVLDLADLQLSASSPNGIQVAHYSNSPAAAVATASNTTGALAIDSYAFATVAPALTVAITAADRVANVSTTPNPFTAFVTPALATAAIGNVKFTLASSVDANGLAITTLAQVMKVGAGESKLEVAGDLSFIAGANAGATQANLTFGAVNADLATPGTNTVSSGKLSTLGAQVFAIGNAANAGNDISITATGAINAGSYSLTFTPVAIASAQFTPATASGALGTITRSGTTIQVPYLTLYSAYNQRLVLVNRGSSAVPYSVTFTSEAGVTATAGSAATGTLAAGKTTILKASDLVALTGGFRTAATVVITAPSSTIDAATTIVNTTDSSTDTVKLN